MRATLWTAHRWLGVVTCLAILLWGLSGVMHPIMSRLQAKPAAFMPPALAWDAAQAPDPAAWLQAQGVTQVLSLHAVGLKGQPHWLAHTDAARPGVLMRTSDGQVVPEGERQLAEALARHYTGLSDTPLAGVRLVTAFDDRYLSVNRLLPVWEVRFARDDGLTAYIDTRQMRLATLSNDTRQTLGQVFRWAHNWSFLDSWPWVQRSVMSLALLAAFLSAATGLYFWWTLRRSAAQRLAHRPLKRWHRRLGLVVALTSLAFASSGAFHLWTKVVRQSALPLHAVAPATPPLGPVRALQPDAWAAVQALGTVGRVDLIAHEGSVAWWVHPAGHAGPRAQVAALAQPAPAAEHAHHASKGPTPPPHTAPGRASAHAGPTLVTADGSVLTGAAPMLARALAAHHSGLAPDSLGATTQVTRFEGEYGFLNKRLPVWRVETSAPGNPRYYVELGTGALASRVDDLDALEGYVFSVLHKWHVGNIPKDLRDGLSASFALGNVIVAWMGMVLFLRRGRPR
ncbi:MAG: hypothetical protein ACK4K3_08730 [Aquabacterium sp.]|jgi:hypothetical protein